MRDILFQTDMPARSQGRAEFYDLRMVETLINGLRHRIVREVHGWWDNVAGQAVFEEGSTIDTPPFTSHREAFLHYYHLRTDRIKAGFQYPFVWHPVTGVPVKSCPDGNSD